MFVPKSFWFCFEDQGKKNKLSPKSRFAMAIKHSTSRQSVVTFRFKISPRRMACRLEALAVHDGWAGLVVLLLADPHLLEGGQGGQDGAADPDGVFPLWWGDDLDLHGAGSQGSDFLLHSVGNTWEHCGASGQYGVGVQILTDVDVALHDGVVCGFMDTSRLHTQEGWLEERLGISEPFVANGDDLTVGQLVALLEGGG